MGQGYLETKHCASDAYKRSMRPYHGTLLATVYGAMLGQMPSRRKLLQDLAKPTVSARTSTAPADLVAGSATGARIGNASDKGGGSKSLFAGKASSRSSGSADGPTWQSPPSAGLGAPPPHDLVVYREMRAFRDLLGPMVQELHQFFIDHRLDDPWKA